MAYVLTDAIEDSMLPVTGGAWVAMSVGLVSYSLVARIRPRQQELEALQGGGG